jgi:WD40 repeat protein
VFERNDQVLKADKLNFQKLVNGNYGHEHGSVVTSTCFHPKENLLMSSGLDRKVKIFQVSQTSQTRQGVNNFNNVESA